MSHIAKTPAPPYYAVIFTSLLSDSTAGYESTAQRMLELAALQPGFLGIESARDDTGITVSYWRTLDAIKQWQQQAEHLQAQIAGKETWYLEYKVRVVLVERDYGFSQ
jgi:heme-degrading monooxygenase HmoA